MTRDELKAAIGLVAENVRDLISTGHVVLVGTDDVAGSSPSSISAAVSPSQRCTEARAMLNIPTFSKAADAAAAHLDGYTWSDCPVESPAQILSRYAYPIDLACLAPHRQYSETELLRAIDEHGLDVVRVDGGYVWARNGISSTRRFRTVTGAALQALLHAAPHSPVCARASTYFAVAPWLAYALEQAGEIVRHTPAGVSVWAACGEDGAVSDDNPLLIGLYEHLILRAERRAGAA